ncbi:Uncharacterised protein [Yersinia frederiksenii]|nr:hypothetical protein CBW53_01725 [Yersinia frederiksenii]CNI35587.1 Uncharacterised protein [Yersinia frederiksenii]CNI93269.1 Uncharacterised protein [Yersinia frederiksenii]CNK21945.1 Uncharacterised protein [Yersinia frederiksenii]
MFFSNNTFELFMKNPSRYLGTSGIVCGILLCIESIRSYFMETDLFGMPNYQTGNVNSLLYLFSTGVIVMLIGIYLYRKSILHIK